MFKALLLLLSPALLLAQLSWNAVTVTAARSSYTSAERILFLVSVGAGPDVALDNVVAPLQPVGITAGDLVGVTPQLLQSRSEWQFRLVVPLAKIKETTAALATIERNLAQNGGKLSLSFTIQGRQYELQPAQTCDWAGVLADARAQAKSAAGAAGLTAGNILALTGNTDACRLTARFALGLMYGQTEPNSITAQVTSTGNVQTDQAVIGLDVSSALDAGVDDIMAALQAVGVTGTGFSELRTWQLYGPNGGPQSVLRWSFTLAVPFARLKETLVLLAEAQQAMAKKASLPALSFAVSGTQASSAALESQACPHSDLVAEARAQAQKMATAAGVAVGPILSMSDIDASAVYPTAVLRAYSSAPTYSCSLAVQFQLLRN